MSHWKFRLRLHDCFKLIEIYAAAKRSCAASSLAASSCSRDQGKEALPFFFLLVVGLFWPKPRCLVLGLLGLERRCALLGCVPYTCRTKGSGRWSKRTMGQVWSSGTSPAKPGCSAPCYFSGDAYDKQDFIQEEYFNLPFWDQTASFFLFLLQLLEPGPLWE